MSPDQELVLRVHPRASCSGPVKLYWPGQGTHEKYIVTTFQHSSQTFANGDTPEEAWANAAERIRWEQLEQGWRY